MTEQFLDGAKIDAVIEQMGRKRMPERMRGNVERRTLAFEFAVEDVADAAVGQRPALEIQKKRFIIRGCRPGAKSRPDDHEIILQAADRGIVDRYVPVFGAFAVDKQGLGSEIKVREFDTDQLADADARAIEQFEQRHVAFALQGRIVDAVQKFTDFVFVGELGEPFLGFGQHRVFKGVGGTLPSNARSR